MNVCKLKTQKIKALELDLKGLFENTKLQSFLLVLNKKNPGWSVVYGILFQVDIL